MNPIDSDILFAVGSFGEFWKSTDGGQSWYGMQIDPVPPANDIAIDPSNPATMYLACSNLSSGYGIGKSTDMGESWFFIHNNLDSLGFAKDIEIDPVDTRIIYFSRLYIDYSGGERCLSKSTDAGSSWQDVTPESLSVAWVNETLVYPLDHNVLFCCTNADGVRKSTNAGATWFRCNNGLHVPAIASIAVDTITGDLYIGTYFDGIYKSTDEGATWYNISYDINLGNCTDMSFSQSTSPKAYVTMKSGLFELGPDTSWSRMEVGLPFTNVLNSVESDLRDPDLVYLASMPYFSQDSASGFYLSQDGGATWEFRNTGLPPESDYWDIAICNLSDEARRILLASSTGIYFSDDLGLSWQQSTDGLPPDNYYYVIESSAVNYYNVAAGDYFGRVFVSFDAGASWSETAQLPESENPFIIDLEFGPFDADWLYVSNEFEGIYRSTDSGLNWTNINGDLPWVHSYFDFIEISGICLNPLNPDNIFVYDATYGVYQTHNGGIDWEPFNVGLDTTIWSGNIEFFPGDTTELFLASSTRSVWSIHRTITGVDDDSPTLPKTLSLSSYPNPFNSSTTINYWLPQSGPVSISIHNILGQHVATILKGQQNAGNHSIVWDAGEFPSGLYFARLTAGEEAQTEKMLLLK
jgi:photosystem II stability/assembly factor-like uncharacterized protein